MRPLTAASAPRPGAPARCYAAGMRPLLLSVAAIAWSVSPAAASEAADEIADPAEVVAQDPTVETALSPAILDAVTARRRTERRGMTMLATWATTNLVVGVPAGIAVDDPRTRAFFQGNAAWNVVNLALAGSSLLRGPRPLPPDLATAAAEADGLDRALLVNIGLDVAYIAAGWALSERAARTASPQLAGWSDALVLQGSFLLGFDVALFAAHQRWSRKIRRASRDTAQP